MPAGQGDPFLPREVMVVLQVQQHVRAQVTGHVAVYAGVVGRRVVAHELHGRPVLLAGFAVQVQPGQVPLILRKSGAQGHGQPAVMGRDHGAGPPAAAVGKQGEIGTPVQPFHRFLQRQFTELDEMVAAPAGAQLAPGLVPGFPGHGRDGPVPVEDRVVPAFLETGAHAEAGLRGDGLFQPVRPPFVPQRVQRQVQDGQLHPAGDIDAHGVGYDRVVGGQHAADGQAVAHVGVRHQRARQGHGQGARPLHLPDRLPVQVPPPLPVWYFGCHDTRFPLKVRLSGIGASNRRRGSEAGDLLRHGHGRDQADHRARNAADQKPAICRPPKVKRYMSRSWRLSSKGVGACSVHRLSQTTRSPGRQRCM